MSNVPAEVSAYFSKIAKDASQNLSPEARHLRARTAADARWARVRAQANPTFAVGVRIRAKIIAAGR
jgi:hypothetical protein